MLYAVSILYTLLTSPASIFLAIASPSYQLAPAFRLQWTLLRLLFYLCHSVNFILFCASGTVFRQEFILFLNSKCGLPRRWIDEEIFSGSIGTIVKNEEETINQSIRYKNYSDYRSSRCERSSPKFNRQISNETKPIFL
jgi:hypothetical protein